MRLKEKYKNKIYQNYNDKIIESVLVLKMSSSSY